LAWSPAVTLRNRTLPQASRHPGRARARRFINPVAMAAVAPRPSVARNERTPKGIARAASSVVRRTQSALAVIDVTLHRASRTMSCVSIALQNDAEEVGRHVSVLP